MKTQVMFIHGGDSFNTNEEYLSFLRNYKIDSLDYLKRKSWKESLQKDLGDNFEVIAPRMPNSMNARYAEWKIWFEKFIPFLNDGVILIGNSMGGIFFAKYLSENTFPKKILGLFLVAPPFDEADTKDALVDFKFSGNLEKLREQCNTIYLYQSTDDPVVPFADLEKYKKELPNAHATVFTDRGHFWQENFPEIVKDIRSII